MVEARDRVSERERRGGGGREGGRGTMRERKPKRLETSGGYCSIIELL